LDTGLRATSCCVYGVAVVLLLGSVAWGVGPEAVDGVSPPARARPRRATLRIACFNAENLAVPGEDTRLTRYRFDPARRRHFERIAAVVETLDPDIIVIPEVLSSMGVEALVRLLHEKGRREFHGYHVDGRDHFSGFDVAVLSRTEPDEIDGAKIHLYAPQREQASRDQKPAGDVGPASEDAWLQESYAFTDDLGKERVRTAVLQRHAVVCFTVRGRKIGLLGLHLKSNPSESASNAQRMAETRIACAIVKRKIVANGYLPVVLGDLNDYDPDVPMADSVRMTQTTVLRDLKNYDDATAGDELVNVAKYIPRVADRYTSHWDFNENGVADPEDVFTMIDHVLVHRELVPMISRVFICHAFDLDVSDHFPVVVDFSLD